MAQAKTLTPQEFERLLAYVAGRSFAMRNRMMILISFWSGMRVGEIANLKVGDVIDTSGKVKQEIRLAAAQTKGNYARTVFLPEKLRDELQRYVDLRGKQERHGPCY